MEKPPQKKPVIVKKGNIAFIKSPGEKSPVKIHSIFKDDVLYETKDIHFLKGEYQRLLLINRMNLMNKCIVTVAKFFSEDGTVLEKTSEEISSLIGQEQYTTVFSGLCSILDQNLKIRSILALLNPGDKKMDVKKEKVDQSCQTNEMRIKMAPERKKRRLRLKLGPYIVDDFKAPEPKKMKRVTVQISGESTQNALKKHKTSTNLDQNSEETDQVEDKSLESQKRGENSEKHLVNSNVTDVNSQNSTLPVIELQGELSNDSIGGYSTLSIETYPELLENPMSMLVDKCTKDTIENYYVQHGHFVTVKDGDNVAHISLPCKPEDDLHIATPDNLQILDEHSKKLLIKHQMMMDQKHCLTVVDNDGNLPIHLAVLNEDVGLLQRQCIVLKLRNRSVDIPTNGLTPLKMSLYQESTASTSVLLKFGADILQTDMDHRTPLHVAAERNTPHLQVLVKYCKDNARNILLESDLWKPEMETQTDQQLEKILLNHVCSAADKQGYTPLMLASKIGCYKNAKVLLELAPETINFQMPTSGNTALYLVCEAAHNNSLALGNKTKLEEHFQKTIELLVQYGADPATENYLGANVNTLLTELNCPPPLSSLVNKEMIKCNIKKNFVVVSTAENSDKVMLIKTEMGTIDVTPIEKRARTRPVKILQNIQIKKPSDSNKSKPIAKQSAGKMQNVKVLVAGKTLKRKMAGPVKQ